METIETVRGTLDVESLGLALMHEHVFVLQPEALQNYGHVWGESYWDEDARVRDAIEKLRAVREAGFRTLVDPTAPGLGRCIPRIQRLNAEVDLNIVVASGAYAFVELPHFPHYPSAAAAARRRGGRPEHRRGASRLRLRRAPQLPPRPQRGGDSGALRPRAPRGHR